METGKVRENPLGYEKIGSLLGKFAIPSIISMLVGSLYNIVDQFFIGRSVGPLGNAATNIAFPLSISCVALGLLFGIGGASTSNIALDQKKEEEAADYMGNAISMLFISGILLGIFSEAFLPILLKFFGSPADVYPYALTYTRITCIGMPFLILTTGGGNLIRADGRPKNAMICNLSGAILNTVLDALFVFVFKWGIAGAAWATIIGQTLSAVLGIYYLANCKTMDLKLKNLKLKMETVGRVASLGTAAFSNQIAMMVVQIVMNNSLKHYGALSNYGESIPIACAGIISKVNGIFISIVVGISQGLQPIVSFNHGAGNHKRVKEGYMTALRSGAVLALLVFLAFQIFPGRIISIFGDGSPEYFEFGIKYLRVFMFFTFLNFVQPITSNFFTAIGSPKVGMFLSLTRQIIYLLPLIIVLPLIMGIDGIMYAGPAADLLAALTTAFMMFRELKKPIYNG